MYPGCMNDKEKMEAAGRSVLGDYPIFEESHRDELNCKILRHYWLWEIGFETPNLWKFELQNLMKEIMPYYNQLYWTESLKYDPLKYSGGGDTEHFTGWGDLKGRWTEERGSEEVKNQTENVQGRNTSKGSNQEGGTVTDNGSDRDTGTITDKGLEKNTGTVKDSASSLTTVTSNKTIEASGSSSFTDKTDFGGTVGTVSQTAGNATDTLKGKVTVDDNVDNRFLDTPEGSIENLKSLQYLTDYRLIATDTTTNTDNKSTNEHSDNGTVNETHGGSDTLTHTGTESSNSGENGHSDTNASSDNTKELDTSLDKTNTQTLNTTKTTTNTMQRDLTSSTNTSEETETSASTNSNGTANSTGNGGKEDLHRDEHWKTSTRELGIYLPEHMPEIREMILNIDLEIIKKLHICFMNIW